MNLTQIISHNLLNYGSMDGKNGKPLSKFASQQPLLNRRFGFIKYNILFCIQQEGTTREAEVSVFHLKSS